MPTLTAGPTAPTATAPAATAPDRRSRELIALGAGVLAALLVIVVLRLGSAAPLGVEDNGDGFRLFCGAGLHPVAPEGIASWRGGWTTTYVPGTRTCSAPVPSSALVAVLLSRLLAPAAWSPTVLGGLYAVLVGLVIGVGTWAASAAGRRRALVVAVPFLPVLATPFARFLSSTYSEPAGLLGTLAVAVGIAALLVTRREHRSARLAALVLVAVGGLAAATAKVAYFPVLGAALLACVLTLVEAPRPRRAGLRAAVITVLVAIVPLGLASVRQEHFYAAANAHDLVFTTVLLEVGPTAAGELGLPPEAATLTGTGFYNGPPRPDGAGWWNRAIVDEPGATRAAALRVLAEHPAAAARTVGVGLQATTYADLPYLDAGPARPDVRSVPAGDRGWSGAQQPDLHQVLASGRFPPWLPSVLVALALLAAATARWQGRARPWSLAAGLAAATALGLVVVTVTGDGYFEVFKHVWLAAYLLVLAALGLLGAAAVGLHTVIRWAVTPRWSPT